MHAGSRKAYLDYIPAGPDAKNFTGKRLDPTVYEKVCMGNMLFRVLAKSTDPISNQMSAEQIGQLYELMHATKDVWKNPEP
jgi:hypothetical protein